MWPQPFRYIFLFLVTYPVKSSYFLLHFAIIQKETVPFMRSWNLFVLSHECMFLHSLSRHKKDLEWPTLKPPRRVTTLRSWTDCVIGLSSRMGHVIAFRQISVTALFYLEDSRKIHLWGVRACRSKDTKRRVPQHACMRAREREREREPLAPLFICLSLPGPVLCKLGQPGVLFILPQVLTPILGSSFVLFLRAFPFLVF